MWHRIGLFAVLFASHSTLAFSESLGEAFSIDSATQQIQDSSVWPEVPLKNVTSRKCRPQRRMYVSGILGPSFASMESLNVNGPKTADTVFTGGLAVGLSLERNRGRLRLETEALGRSEYFGERTSGQAADRALNNWSVLGNVWRDFMLTNRFGIYGGGGLGGGGYQYSARATTGVTLSTEPVAAFAWQAGGGLVYEITERLTFDMSYRYFQIDNLSSPLSNQPLISLETGFASSQLMFSLRLYEPFRGLLR